MLGQDVVELLQSKNQEVQFLDCPQVDLTLFDSLRSQACDADVVANCVAFTVVNAAEEQERQASDVNVKAVQYSTV